jgi:hypothetical protein
MWTTHCLYHLLGTQDIFLMCICLFSLTKNLLSEGSKLIALPEHIIAAHWLAHSRTLQWCGIHSYRLLQFQAFEILSHNSNAQVYSLSRINLVQADIYQENCITITRTEISLAVLRSRLNWGLCVTGGYILAIQRQLVPSLNTTDLSAHKALQTPTLRDAQTLA